jgi:hypothetical protein
MSTCDRGAQPELPTRCFPTRITELTNKMVSNQIRDEWCSWLGHPGDEWCSARRPAATSRPRPGRPRVAASRGKRLLAAAARGSRRATSPTCTVASAPPAVARVAALPADAAARVRAGRSAAHRLTDERSSPSAAGSTVASPAQAARRAMPREGGRRGWRAAGARGCGRAELAACMAGGRGGGRAFAPGPPSPPRSLVPTANEAGFGNCPLSTDQWSLRARRTLQVAFSDTRNREGCS